MLPRMSQVDVGWRARLISLGVVEFVNVEISRLDFHYLDADLGDRMNAVNQMAVGPGDTL